MKFGRVPVEGAAGSLLAHSVQVGGRPFKKGRLLSDEDVEALVGDGVDTIVVARLEVDDVGEDAAAATVAEAVQGENISASAAFTGRVNLFAETHGVFVVDTARLDRINLLHESMTVATLPAYALVEPRQMLATIKVIPFAAPAAVVERCRALAADGGPLSRVAALRRKRIALIQTTLPGLRTKVLDKTVQTTRARIESIGSELSFETRCAHDEAEIAEAIANARAGSCDIILIAGASAIVDRRDVLPAGIERAGGTVIHFGMPVDPGNLILMAELDGMPVVGLPGCARSPKLNGYDWVLRRLAADIPVGPRDIMLMGAGGLLTEIPTRPLPRAKATTPDSGLEQDEEIATVPHAPIIAAIVLAGGQSRRMGAANKLLTEVGGTPMLRTAVDAALSSKADPVFVVTGHEDMHVRGALQDRAVTIVHNPDFAGGLSTSLRAGIQALPDEVDGAVVCLGDMPQVTTKHIDRLIAAYNPLEGRAICVPTYKGKQGNPVLWDRKFFTEILTLSGDVGAKHLIGENADAVVEVAVDDPGILLDIDTPEALAAVNSPARSRP